MNTDEMLLKLMQYGDVETATAIWSEANELEKKAAEVKRACMAIVEKHLRETGEAKGKTATAVYGWTNPKPKLVLNQSKWQNAIQDDDRLYKLAYDFDLSKTRLENAQKAFYEEVDGTPRVYIK